MSQRLPDVRAQLREQAPFIGQVLLRGLDRVTQLDALGVDGLQLA
jgi:hypothetical protein